MPCLMCGFLTQHFATTGGNQRGQTHFQTLSLSSRPNDPWLTKNWFCFTNVEYKSVRTTIINARQYTIYTINSIQVFGIRQDGTNMEKAQVKTLIDYFMGIVISSHQPCWCNWGSAGIRSCVCICWYRISSGSTLLTSD